MHCVACDRVIKTLSYKQYKEKDPHTGKTNIITTNIEEDLCSRCLADVRESNFNQENVDIYNDLDIGIELPSKPDTY